ncbi:hypothetical protein [Streptomyces sp. NRRL S-1824]|uniref:hypothetical protein n=1 Tax=Streptomyces sp. NRRL S-1824 TaxID=1463889 RepID=UPI0004C94EDD|nr:hypothetical protein [Streptomyces sp. NRRL S-1824]
MPRPEPVPTRALLGRRCVADREPHLRLVVRDPNRHPRTGRVLAHFGQRLLEAFGAQTGFAWKSLGVLLVRGAAGAVVAVRRFRWEPRPE